MKHIDIISAAACGKLPTSFPKNKRKRYGHQDPKFMKFIRAWMDSYKNHRNYRGE